MPHFPNAPPRSSVRGLPNSLSIPVGSFALTVAGRVYHTDPAVLLAHRVGEPPPATTTPSAVTRAQPRYSLRKGLGLWRLTFDGREADLKHERGVFYVAWLLLHAPTEPVHGLDLAGKIPALYRQQLALTQITDPATGTLLALPSNARLQERNLGLDDAQSLRALFRKEQELEAILDDNDESEPVKQEALRELEAIADFRRRHGARTRDSADRIARTVRQSIVRFHRHLLATADPDGHPHPVLRPFAAHLERYLLIPSARYGSPASRRARGPLAGCFTYQPPPGVTWTE